MTRQASELLADGNSVLFRDAFPGQQPRRAQAEFAAAIEDCMEGFDPSTPSIALVQAETGIGKAMGYALPAALYALRTGIRVVISTHTIELQNQLMRETLPLVAGICRTLTGHTLSFGRRIGRRNFISLTALSDRMSRLGGACSEEARALLASASEYLLANPADATIQAVEERYGDWIRELGDQIPFAFDELTLDRIDGDDAGYRDMVATSHMVDILVVNHALLVTDLINHGRVLFPDARDEDASSTMLIVDEADALPDVAESMQFGKLPFFRLRSVQKILEEHGVESAGSVGKAADKVFGALSGLTKTDGAGMRVATSDRAAILPAREMEPAALSVIGDNLRRIEKAIRAAKSVPFADWMELQQVSGEIEGVISGLDALENNRSSSFVGAYWTPVRGMPGLYFAGATPEDIVSRLWRRNPTAIRPGAVAFVSATLSSTTPAEGEPINLSEFRHRVGLSAPWAPVSMAYSFAPEEFGNMDFVVVDQGLAPPVSIKIENEHTESVATTNPSIIPWWAGMIKAAAAGGERVLVLTISFSDATAISEAISGSGLQVILDRAGDKSGIKRFSETPGSVFITPGKWSGIDLPGKVRNIVVTRLPFSPMDSVHNAHLEALLKSASPDKLLASRFPALLARARRKFRQGIGRGLRRADDKVTIWIGDARWPVPIGRTTAAKQPPWSRSFEQTVPARFQAALRSARIFDPLRGVTKYAAKKSGLLSRR